MDRAVKDTLLFQTTDVRLRKKVLAKDMTLEDMVKMGLAQRQTQIKLDKVANANGKRGEDLSIARVVEEAVKRLNLVPSPSKDRRRSGKPVLDPKRWVLVVQERSVRVVLTVETKDTLRELQYVRNLRKRWILVKNILRQKEGRILSCCDF